jgi:hypothetical protein
VKSLSDALALSIVVVPWIMGIALAKGFWSTAGCIFPPWAWYLVAEHYLK